MVKNPSSRDRLVVRTLRCGRSNPGSNPGHGIFLFEKGKHFQSIFLEIFFWLSQVAEPYNIADGYFKTFGQNSTSQMLSKTSSVNNECDRSYFSSSVKVRSKYYVFQSLIF